MKKIRIANGAGYAGDRLDAGEVLIERGNIDYLTFECLAERTIGLCQRDKMHDPNLGYSRLSEERLRRTLKLAKEHGVKIISNLGAANPEAAIRLIQKICREQEIVGLKLAAVTGDNIFDKVEKYYDYNVLEFNGKLGDIREKLISGNAYCGVEGIVEALKNGADVVITGNAGKTVAEDSFDEGDVLVYATNSEGYISRIYSVFAAQNVLNGSSFEDFRTNAFKKQSSVLADTKFADLLSDDDNDVNVVFGPVVDKSGSNITIGTVTTNAEGKYVVNYDEGLEVNYSNAKIYTYDFAARSDNSRVLLDEGIASTPDVKAAKTTVGGQDILNLEHEDVIDDVVFAVVRTTDKDEAQEIYLIVNND